MVITVSRQFGSGGRELARRLAEALGYSYYDNEIIQLSAAEGGEDEHFVNHVSQSGLARFYSSTIATRFSARISASTLRSAEVIGSLSRTLSELAGKGDCVIVGRAADAILSSFSPLRLFVYADKDARIGRCLNRASGTETLTVKEIERRIREIDKGREAFHALFSENKWGDKENYDLCINTSGCTIKSLVPSIASYALAWGGGR